MKYALKMAVIATLLMLAQFAQAQQYSKITYVHSDPDGTPFAATDLQGSIEWQIDHYPFGSEYENTQVARKSDISFAGKPYDEEIGLSYFGGRWYDPDLGRFTSIDPMPVNPEDYRSFNRYAYGFNNPYKYVDPDGNFPFLIPVAIFIAKEIAAEVASRATGGATDFLSVRRLGQKGLRKGAQLIANRGQKKLGSAVKGACCFVAGTLVLTEGGYKNIEDVALGEKLWAKNTDTNEEGWKPVTKLWREADRPIYEIQAVLADGRLQKIEATDDHPFYVEGHGWKNTIDLKQGDQLESNLGEPLTVKSVVDENRSDLTYNFTVADYHTYYVTKHNVLVHNCDATKGLSQRAAAREAKRQAGIPTSQQAVSQQSATVSGNKIGRQQTFDVPSPGGGIQQKSVQVSRDLRGKHAGLPQIEAGNIKPGGQLDAAGRPRIENTGKVRVDFDDG